MFVIEIGWRQLWALDNIDIHTAVLHEKTTKIVTKDNTKMTFSYEKSNVSLFGRTFFVQIVTNITGHKQRFFSKISENN